MVAQVLKSTPSKVERSMRYCIEKINKEQLAKCDINPLPTNGEFIYGFIINSLGEIYDNETKIRRVN